MADAHPRGNHPEAVEGLLGPAQQLVALDVAVVLDVDVLVVGAGPVGGLGDHRVVHHHLDGHERVDHGRVAAELTQGVAHGSQVDDARHPRQVLHEHALGRQCDLGGVGAAHAVTARVDAPAGDGLDVGGRDGQAVLVAQQVLQDDLDGVGQAGDVEPVGEGLDPEDLVGAVPDRQVAAGTEGVGGGGGIGHTSILPRPGAPRIRRCLRSGCGSGEWPGG